MMTNELYYVEIDLGQDRKLTARLYRVAHLFSPELVLAKRVGLDRSEERGNSLMYVETNRDEYGDPYGMFFDSVKKVIEYLSDNGCTDVDGAEAVK
jgi:hypothetical protein